MGHMPGIFYSILQRDSRSIHGYESFALRRLGRVIIFAAVLVWLLADYAQLVYAPSRVSCAA